jgi:cation diffusion facilitator family transporter
MGNGEMKHLASFLANKLTDSRDLHHPGERHRVGLIESWVSIAGNIFLTLLKGLFGLLTNSVSLTADAVHSASDILSSLVVLIGFSLAKRKPDHEHPHGHGRIEYLAGLLIALMLLAAGIAFAYNAYHRVTNNIYASPGLFTIAVVLFAIALKEFMFHFSAVLGRKIDSEALAADAWHHRSDSLSSILVLIALTGSYLGIPALDAYFGFAIAAFIAYAGYKIARQSCSRLLGKAPDQTLKQKICNSAREVGGVIDIHDLEIHDYGSWKVVTMHIEVDGSISLDQAHKIAHQVEDHISSCFFCDTLVHLDPR